MDTKNEPYKKISSDELTVFVDGKTTKTVPVNVPTPRYIRVFTFLSTNLDLLSLFFLLGCVFVLGYLARCLQTNLSTDQIRLGLEAFLEILVILLASSGALFVKLLAGQGAISKAVSMRAQRIFQNLNQRKARVEKGEISPFGRSIESK
jgi:hypothetical protein